MLTGASTHTIPSTRSAHQSRRQSFGLPKDFVHREALRRSTGDVDRSAEPQCSHHPFSVWDANGATELRMKIHRPGCPFGADAFGVQRKAQVLHRATTRRVVLSQNSFRLVHVCSSDIVWHMLRNYQPSRHLSPSLQFFRAGFLTLLGRHQLCIELANSFNGFGT